MRQLVAKARREVRQFLEGANGLRLMYLRFVEALEHLAHDHDMWGVGAALRDLENYVLSVMRHTATESLRWTAGFGVCFEGDRSCEVTVLSGREPYRLFDT